MGAADLTGKRALVTGGARGFGAAMAEALARSGAGVLIGDVLEDLGRETAELVGKIGPTVRFTPLDITDETSWENAVAAGVKLAVDLTQGGLSTELAGFVEARVGSVKTPKQIEIWTDLPRSKVGKVLKTDIRATLLGVLGTVPPA